MRMGSLQDVIGFVSDFGFEGVGFTCFACFHVGCFLGRVGL